MTDATFTTTCARCAAPLEVTDATVDAVSKAHEGRCFVVGDWVRWEVDDNRWYDGEVVGKFVGGVPAIRVGASGGITSVTIGSVVHPPRYPCAIRKDIRRIPRPEPVVAPVCDAKCQTFTPGDIAEWRLDGLTWERVTVVRAYPGDKFEIEHERTVERWQVHRSEMRRVAREEQAVGCPRPAAKLRDHLVKYKTTITGPAPNCTINGLPPHCPEPLPCGPTRYDGLTGAECMARWSGNRTCVEHGEAPMFEMTPAQITEARRQYLIVAHHTWSRLLAAKVAASSERERLTVVAPDLELETANCKDVE